MKTHFKKGAKVRVREDLQVGKEYGGVLFDNVREQFAGEKAEVRRVYIEPHMPIVYGLTNFVEWVFPAEMLEPVEEPITGDLSFEEIFGGIKKELTFPREMLVRDSENESWHRDTIIGYCRGLKFPFLTYGISDDNYYAYKIGKEIEQIPRKEQKAIKLLESKGYEVTKKI